MNRSRVVLASCRDYDPGRVARALQEALGLLGFHYTPGPKPVLLKPNMLLGADPARGVTTHPAVFGAAARYFKDAGARLVFGDSPNALFNPVSVARKCGITGAAEALGIPMADFQSGEDVSHPQGVQNRKFFVASAAREAGFICNLPKLKTHALTLMTGALKNTFGVIPGMRKAEFHVKHPDVAGFSRMIADLNGCVRSGLVVMDAVTAMEGNGPSGGTLVDMGLLIVSEDPVAADSAACSLIGADPLSVDHIRMAQESGLGNASPDRIEILTTGGARAGSRPFALPFRSAPGTGVPRFMVSFAKRIALPRPVIDERTCRRCGQCVKACPADPKVLTQERRGTGDRAGAAMDGHAPAPLPRFDYGRCLRCYCCQEICPESAISVHHPLVARIFATRARGSMARRRSRQDGS